MPAHSPDDPHTHADAGDGVVVSTVDGSQGAKGPGARRILWLLIASLVLVCLALFGTFAFHAPALDATKTRQQQAGNHQHFAAPQPSPRQAPPTPTEANGGESAAHPIDNAQ